MLTNIHIKHPEGKAMQAYKECMERSKGIDTLKNIIKNDDKHSYYVKRFFRL